METDKIKKVLENGYWAKKVLKLLCQLDGSHIYGTSHTPTSEEDASHPIINGRRYNSVDSAVLICAIYESAVIEHRRKGAILETIERNLESHLNTSESL